MAVSRMFTNKLQMLLTALLCYDLLFVARLLTQAQRKGGFAFVISWNTLHSIVNFGWYRIYGIELKHCQRHYGPRR